MELKKINMDRIIMSKSKSSFDEGEVFILAKSIALAGMLSPITVVALAHSDRYEIVTGIKRFYACRLLGLKEISAIVIKADVYFARAALKRGDYKDFFKEADDLKETVIKTNLSAEELCNLTAYTKNELTALLRLSGMSELEREIVRKNGIQREIAEEISQLDDVCKRNALLSEAVKKRLKKSEISALILREKRGKPLFIKPTAHRTPKFKDLRLFDNTIIKAIQILREAGVETELNTEKSPSATEYKIKIHS